MSTPKREHALQLCKEVVPIRLSEAHQRDCDSPLTLEDLENAMS